MNHVCLKRNVTVQQQNKLQKLGDDSPLIRCCSMRASVNRRHWGAKRPQKRFSKYFLQIVCVKIIKQLCTYFYTELRNKLDILTVDTVTDRTKWMYHQENVSEQSDLRLESSARWSTWKNSILFS